MTKPSPLTFWQRWLLVCLAARAIRLGCDWLAVLLAGAIAPPTVNPGGYSFVLFLLLTAISSALGGWLQWRVLQRLDVGRTWVLATSLGTVAGLVVNQAILQLRLAAVRSSGETATDFIALFAGDIGIPFILVALIQGLVLGACQFLALRKTVPQAIAWIGVSGVAVVVDGITVSLLQAGFGRLNLYGGTMLDPIYWLSWLSGAAIYGAITGLGLMRWQRLSSVKE